MKFTRKQANAMLVASLVLGGIYNAQAANTGNSYTLPDVVVTATRTEEQPLTVPANVTVVSGKTLEQQHYTSLSQTLRDVPGVYIGNYGTGYGFEGSNSLYLNGSNHVLWQVDGMTMNSAGVTPPLLGIRNFTGVSKIEVLKGAASALYGSDAVGGVVNVITQKPDEGVRTTTTVSGGNFGTLNYSISNEGRQGNFYWRGTYLNAKQGDYKDGDGHKIDQYYKGITGSFMVGVMPNQDNDIRLYYDRYLSNSRYSGALGTKDPVEPNKLDWKSTRLLWNSHFKGSWDNRFTVQKNEYNRILGSYDSYWGESISRTNVVTRSISDQVTFTDDYNTWVGGIEWRQDETKSMNGVKLTNMSYFLQDEWSFAPKWTLLPGVRYDHHSSFGSHTSPHVSLSYEMTPSTTAYVSYNSFFIAPTPYQLFAPYYGNSRLNPETGHAWEAGVHHRFSDKTLGSISYFKRHSSDKIAYDFVTSKYINVDTEDAYGISADITHRFSDIWSSHLAYTYTHVDETATRSSNIDGMLPKHSILAGLDYAKGKWDAHLNMRAVIDRPGKILPAGRGPVFPKSTYYITDIAANYAVNDDITIFGCINNLFDVYYAEMSSVTYGADGQWWSAPGRSFEVGTTIRF